MRYQTTTKMVESEGEERVTIQGTLSSTTNRDQRSLRSRHSQRRQVLQKDQQDIFTDARKIWQKQATPTEDKVRYEIIS